MTDPLALFEEFRGIDESMIQRRRDDIIRELPAQIRAQDLEKHSARLWALQATIHAGYWIGIVSDTSIESSASSCESWRERLQELSAKLPDKVRKKLPTFELGDESHRALADALEVVKTLPRKGAVAPRAGEARSTQEASEDSMPASPVAASQKALLALAEQQVRDMKFALYLGRGSPFKHLARADAIVSEMYPELLPDVLPLDEVFERYEQAQKENRVPEGTAPLSESIARGFDS